MQNLNATEIEGEEAQKSFLKGCRVWVSLEETDKCSWVKLRTWVPTFLLKFMGYVKNVGVGDLFSNTMN
jgi:hypothetical protein